MAAVLGKFPEHVLLDPPQRQRAPPVAREQSVAVHSSDRLPGLRYGDSVVRLDGLDGVRFI